MNPLLLKATGLWLLLLVCAIVNGAARDALLAPRVGERLAHQISSVFLSALILLLTFAATPSLGAHHHVQQWLIGGYWLLLTVAFEFVFGRHVLGHPWNRLLLDYDLLHGRLWPLVLATLAASPYLAAKLRVLT